MSLVIRWKLIWAWFSRPFREWSKRRAQRIWDAQAPQFKPSPPQEKPPRISWSMSDLKAPRHKTIPKGQDFDQAATIAKMLLGKVDPLKKMKGAQFYVEYTDGTKDLAFQTFVPSGVFIEQDPLNEFDVQIRLTTIGDVSLWAKGDK